MRRRHRDEPEVRVLDFFGNEFRRVPVSKVLHWFERGNPPPPVYDVGDGEIILRSAGGIVKKVPAVVCMIRQYQKRHIAWTKFNILRRDNLTCAYCGHRGSAREMTVDHVYPKSRCRREGIYSNTWQNTVTCCRPCQNKKGDRLMAEVGMTFRDGYKPFDPNKKGRS